METTVNSHTPATHQFDIEGGGFDEGQGAHPLSFWIGAGGTLAAVGLVFFGFMLHGTFAIQRAGACTSAARQLTTINSLVERGKFSQASALAHATVADASICTSDHKALALAAYHADVAGLITRTHVPGDVVDEQSKIADWHSIQAFGRRYLSHDELESSSHVLDLAYSLGYYALARDAWLSEWRTGGNRDSDAQNLYYSLLVNLGREWVTQASPRYRESGLTYLSLAHFFGRDFGLPRGEADAWLRTFTGAGQRMWPKPAADPLLHSLGHGR